MLYQYGILFGTIKTFNYCHIMNIMYVQKTNILQNLISPLVL